MKRDWRRMKAKMAVWAENWVGFSCHIVDESEKLAWLKVADRLIGG